MMRRFTAGLGTFILALCISGCFLITSPPVSYGVSLVSIPPEGTDPICHEVRVVAVLGENTILEAVRNLNDGIGYATGSEARESAAQPYYVGMPLDVHVSCRNDESLETGSAHYALVLTDISSDAHLTVWNYLSEEQEGQCVEPAAQAGVQLCATIAEGFAVDIDE